MDSFEIIITPDAEADLLEIRDYIAYTLFMRKETNSGRLRIFISIN